MRPIGPDIPANHRLRATTLLCAATALLTFTTAAARVAGVRHVPPPAASAMRALEVEALLLGDVAPEDIATADIIVTGDDVEFRVFPLSFARGVLVGEIPAEFVRPAIVSYYLRVVDAEGGVHTAPPGAEDGSLFSVEVTMTFDGSTTNDEWAWPAASVVAMNPTEGEVTEEETPLIAALFDPPLDEPWHAMVLLDGVDVTDASTVTADAIVHSPISPLTRGPHRVTVSALTPTEAVETSWVFFVQETGGIDDTLWPEPVAYEPPGGARESFDPGAGFRDDSWFVSGRLEAGWAIVSAETTAVESTDVFLPYEEVSRPFVDLYVSGAREDRTFLVTVRHDPVYSKDLDWLANFRSERFEVEAGQMFPSLSRSTLNWTVGHGVRASARVGRGTTELVGMRISESDTLAGFGIYSRFALAGRQSYDVNDRLSASAVLMSVFDREESVPEDQRLTDPLRNTVVAGVVRAEKDALEGELEVGHSISSGDTDGSGSSVRASVQYSRDWHNRVSLEYVASEPDFFTAGSFESDPGEHTLQLDCSWRPGGRFGASGWVRAGREFGDESSLADGRYELRTYSRLELRWPVESGDARTYAILRHDRTPYETHDHKYTYGSIGGTWRRGATRLSGSAAYSQILSPDETGTWSAACDIRQEVIAGRLSARAAGRWSSGTGDETDYVRAHYTLETRWTLGEVDIGAEYWLVDREDRADPLQSYTEHVLRISIGRDL